MACHSLVEGIDVVALFCLYILTWSGGNPTSGLRMGRWRRYLASFFPLEDIVFELDLLRGCRGLRTFTCKERQMDPLILARMFREAHVLLYLGMSFLSDVIEVGASAHG
jgi:hypothetical protein